MTKQDTQLHKLKSQAPAGPDSQEMNVFLDAIAARHRMELDPSQAEAIGKIFMKAARIVEESRSIEADKPTPRGTSPTHFQSTEDWAYVRHHESYDDLSLWPIAQEELSVLPGNFDLPPGGHKIRVEAEDPDILNSFKLAPEGVETSQSSQIKSSGAGELSAARVLLIGGIPAATTASGVLLLIASATKSPLVPNPYLALLVFLVGLAFGVTAVVAVQERQRR